MTLPRVDGWVIDFRTARTVFESGSNIRIDHFTELVGDGQLFVCHQDEKLFKAHPKLKAVFIDEQDCVCFPDQAMMNTCVNVSRHPLCKNLFQGGESAIVITALAATKNLGVISDNRSSVFTTVFDLCKHFGIHSLTADEYFDELK